MADLKTIHPIAAAVQSGRFALAVEMCRNELAHTAGDPDVLQFLGIALEKQGQSEGALATFRRLTELYPNDATHWDNFATALHAAGDFPNAEKAAHTALDLTEGDLDRLERLGLMQCDAGHWPDARDTLLRVLAERPNSVKTRLQAARAYIQCGDIQVDDLVATWRDWQPLTDEQQFELADILTLMGHIKDANQLMRDLLHRAPSNVPAQLQLAKNYERINKLADAAETLESLTASGFKLNQSVCREITRQRAQLAIRERRYDSARVALEQLGEDDPADYAHFFTLARACDRQGDSTATMSALRIAHTRQVEEVYNFASESIKSGEIPLPHVWDRVRHRDYGAWQQLIAPNYQQSPLFVIGFPRSGTTLLEQMLDAHPAMQSMDERPFIAMLAEQLEDAGTEIPGALGRLNQRDCDELRKGYLLLACGKVMRNWSTRLVDKNPLNMLWLPLIHRMFPAAQVILVLRHPCDVVLSCYQQNFRSRALQFVSQSLECLARAYVAAMENCLYHLGLLKPQLFISHYEDLVSDAPTQVERIAHFLKLDDAKQMMNYAAIAQKKEFIATPSYIQVVEPINAASVNHWHHYYEYMEPALTILRPTMMRLGYSDFDVHSGNSCHASVVRHEG